MPTKITASIISQDEEPTAIVASSPKTTNSSTSSSSSGTSSVLLVVPGAIDEQPSSTAMAMPMTMQMKIPAVTTIINNNNINIAAHYLKIDIKLFRQIDLKMKPSLDHLIPPLVPSRGGSLKPPPSITGYSKNFRQVLAQIHRFRCLSQSHQKDVKERWSRMQKWEQHIFLENLCYLMMNKDSLIQMALEDLKFGRVGAGTFTATVTPWNINSNINRNITNEVDASACSTAKSISSTVSFSAVSTASSGSDTHSVPKAFTLAKAQGTSIGEHMFSIVSSPAPSPTAVAAAAATTSDKKRKRVSSLSKKEGREPTLSKTIFHKLASSITARAKLQDIMNGNKTKHKNTNEENTITRTHTNTRIANSSIGDGCTRQPPSLTLTTLSIRRREWASNNSSQGQGQASSSSSSSSLSALLPQPEMIVAGSTKERVISDLIQFLAKMGSHNVTAPAPAPAPAPANINATANATAYEQPLNEKEKENIEEMVSLEDAVQSFQFLFELLVGSAGGEFLEGLLVHMWRDYHCDDSKHGHGHHKGDGDVNGVQGFLAREGVLPQADALSNVGGICNDAVENSDVGSCKTGNGNGIQWLLDDKGSLVSVVRDWSEGVAERTFPSISASTSASASVSCRKVQKISGGVIRVSETDSATGGEDRKRPVLLDLTNDEEG